MSKISEKGVDLRQAMQVSKWCLRLSKRHRPSHFDRRGELQAKSRQLLVLTLAQTPIKGRFADAENLGGFLPVLGGRRQHPLNVLPLDIRQGPMGEIRLFSPVSDLYSAAGMRSQLVQPASQGLGDMPDSARRRVDPRP